MKIHKLYTLLFLCLCNTGYATDLYVSNTGNDGANGLYMQTAKTGLNGPFQTLARAQQAIRSLTQGGKLNQPVTVHIGPGKYLLTSPLQLTALDSGLSGRQITWEGQGSNTVISGGIVLNNCQTIKGLWQCPVAGLGLDKILYQNSGLKIGNIPGFNLFINNQRMNLARWPDTDWAHIKIPTDNTTTFSSFEQIPDIQDEIAHTQIHIMTTDWYDQYLPLANVNQSLNQIRLSIGTNQPLTSGYRFYLQNLQSQLNAPGEWFYDKSNSTILFIPPEGVTPQNIVVSSLPNLITMNAVTNVIIQNLSFQNSTNDAITAINSNNVLLNNLEITNVDNNAISINNSSYMTVSNSHIHDTGGFGVQLSGGDRINLIPSNYLVYNNHFEKQAAIIIMSQTISTSGVGSHISNNMIENSPGPGVIIYGNDHIVEKNEISNVCQQESDCGAIYSGKDWTYRGNIIRYNSLHDIYGYGLLFVDAINNIVNYGTSTNTAGVYLDDAVSGFNVFGNIFNNAGTMAIHIGGGRDNVIENNIINTNNNYSIFVDNRSPTFDWTPLSLSLTSVPYLGAKWSTKYPALALPMQNPTWPEGNTIQNNIFINYADSPTLSYDLPVESTKLANNLYWSSKGKTLISYNILDNHNNSGTVFWQSWMQLGIEKNSFFDNPCAIINTNSVTFCQGSPINKIGFQALPTDFGLIK